MSVQVPSLVEFKAGNIKDIADWSGKKFGEIRGHRVIDRNIRILSHTGGFAIFFPSTIWRDLDSQVPLSFPLNPNSSCWIADRDFAIIKIDADPSQLAGADRDYVSEKIDVALNKIETFVRKNFFENGQAYPDSDYFTHGSFKDDPNMPRPIRFRLGGNFHFQY
jgi:hypothetical protein